MTNPKKPPIPPKKPGQKKSPKANELTSQQEKFAQSIASGMNQSDAYRTSYKVRKGTKPVSVNQAASKLMSNPHISSRVTELRKPIVEAAQITLAGHLTDLLTLREKAVEADQLSAAITAEVARGKASGLYVEKHDVTLSVNTATAILAARKRVENPKK